MNEIIGSRKRDVKYMKSQESPRKGAQPIKGYYMRERGSRYFDLNQILLDAHDFFSVVKDLEPLAEFIILTPPQRPVALERMRADRIKKHYQSGFIADERLPICRFYYRWNARP